MSKATDLVAQRIVKSNSEGFRAEVYDDKTGLSMVSLAQGSPTIGYGTRCEQWSKAFAWAVMELSLETIFEPDLLQKDWYLACDDYRRSVLLEIAYNQGSVGLENGYPKMIAAIQRQDWAAAQAECTVEDPRLKARYDTLGKILYAGAAWGTSVNV